MNYMLVQRTGDDVSKPCEIIQMFTDDQILLLGEFVQDAIDRDIYEPGARVAGTFMHLLKQRENKTL